MWYRVRQEGLCYVGECVYNGKVIATFKAFSRDKALSGVKTVIAMAWSRPA